MANATADRATPELVVSSSMRSPLEFPVAANTTLYCGSAAQFDASGRLVPAAGTGTTVGRVEQTVTCGSVAGSVLGEVKPGTFGFFGSGIQADDIGKRCKFIDSQTVTLDTNGDCVVDWIEGGLIYVRIEAAANPITP